jgi:esterase/lipase superfamily enzyme
MRGGVVQVGPTEEQIRRLLSAQGKDLERLVRDLVAQMNKQQVRGQAHSEKGATFTAGAVEQFLITHQREESTAEEIGRRPLVR